ncbi:unnamed protein product [Clonostachys byssicola]|uniref:Aspartate aminotransferase n=1 Tax=Clonostachys byssicola TaxID=160290 RepID=A0A9N9U9X8_9HYPO|nr:unnamed protein product [Clonostachys byssicola]
MGSSQPSTLFSSLTPVPYDEAYNVKADFDADVHPNKVNLGIGVYRDNDGKAWALPSVELTRRQSEIILLQKAIPSLPNNHDYIPAGGLPQFVMAAQKLLFGSLYSDIRCRLASVQTISGSGACHLGTSFLAKTLKPRSVWISDPSWINHSLIWEVTAPDVQLKFYPYFDAGSKSIDFSGMNLALESRAEKGDVVLLQACAHNPTGCDPTHEQWKQLADLCEKKGLIPFFDIAYQGFASGVPDEDAWSVRHFAERKSMDIVIAQSFSKNFGLYGQRVGALHILASEASVVSAIVSNLVRLIRSEYSSPASWGCRIVAKVLEDPDLREKWLRDLKQMNHRIKFVRQALFEELQKLGTPRTWEHLIRHIGMFSYTGLRPEEVKRLKHEYHIHMFSSGRASVAGLNTHNIIRVAKSIDIVVRDTENNMLGR